MDQIFVFILFLFPGFLVFIIRDAIFPRKMSVKSQHYQYTEAGIYSFIVLIMNILELRLYFKIQIATIPELVNRFNELNFIFGYTILCIVNSLIACLAYQELVKPCYIWLYNKLLRRGIAQRAITETAYDELLKGWKDQSVIVISIEKDGIPISYGLVDYFGDSNNHHCEINLKNTNLVRYVLDEDKKHLAKDRTLYHIDKEYVNLDTGIVIKQYDPHWFKERWIIEENEAK